jgi:hypothetical protein
LIRPFPATAELSPVREIEYASIESVFFTTRMGMTCSLPLMFQPPNGRYRARSCGGYRPPVGGGHQPRPHGGLSPRRDLADIGLVVQHALDLLVDEIPHPQHHLGSTMLLEFTRRIEPVAILQDLGPDGIDSYVICGLQVITGGIQGLSGGWMSRIALWY